MKTIEFYTTKSGSGDFTNMKKHVWELDGQLNIDDLLKMKEFSNFKLAATIVEDSNTSGYKIKLEDFFVGKPFVIYLLVKDGKVLKGGKSKNTLDSRSYSAGTEESWTNRGTPSVTNYVWSQIFRESLKDGKPILFYGYVVPSYELTYPSFDGEVVTEMVCGHYETEELKLNHLLSKLNGRKVIGEGKLLELNKK